MDIIIIVLLTANLIGLYKVFRSNQYLDSLVDQRLNHVCLNFIKLEERVFEAIEKKHTPYDCSSHLEEIQSDIKKLSHDLTGKSNKPKKERKQRAF